MEKGRHSLANPSDTQKASQHLGLNRARQFAAFPARPDYSAGFEMSQSQGKVRKAIANGRLGRAATSERCSGRACTGPRRAASSPWAARRLGCRGRVERLHPRGSARSSGPRARITPDTARPLGFSHRDGHAARPPCGSHPPSPMGHGTPFHAPTCDPYVCLGDVSVQSFYPIFKLGCLFSHCRIPRGLDVFQLKSFT